MRPRSGKGFIKWLEQLRPTSSIARLFWMRDDQKQAGRRRPSRTDGDGVGRPAAAHCQRATEMLYVEQQETATIGCPVAGSAAGAHHGSPRCEANVLLAQGNFAAREL
ncbi:MAG: hypothetical protein IPO05_17210 [Flavobacteriales bacterium]|nr:hypothetical protein [Flavobacteriales bacterium]